MEKDAVMLTTWFIKGWSMTFTNCLTNVASVVSHSVAS